MIADFDPCGCGLPGVGNLEKVGTGTMILSGTNTYTGTTTVIGGTLQVDGSTASSSQTTVKANTALTGIGTVGNTTIEGGGILLPGSGVAGSSLNVAGNLAFQSGALYLVTLNSTTASFTNVTGTADLAGQVGASVLAGSTVKSKYTILTAAGGRNGQFAGVDTSGVPGGLVASLSYDANNAYLNFALDYAAKFKPQHQPAEREQRAGELLQRQWRYSRRLRCPFAQWPVADLRRDRDRHAAGDLHRDEPVSGISDRSLHRWAR